MIRAFPKTRFMKFDVQGEYKKGEIDAVLTSYNNVDTWGDVILPGALDKFMKETTQIPMLWSHSSADPIGTWANFREDGDLFRAKGRLLDGIQRADEAKILFEKEIVDGVSIGFDTYDEASYKIVFDKDLPFGMGYEFFEIKLKEASLVLWGANANAEITGLKTQLKNEDGELDARAIERFLKTFGGLSRTEAADILNPYRESLKVERFLSGVVKDSTVSDSSKTLTGALLDMVK